MNNGSFVRCNKDEILLRSGGGALKTFLRAGKVKKQELLIKNATEMIINICTTLQAATGPK